jgi:hypothetical protein
MTIRPFAGTAAALALLSAPATAAAAPTLISATRNGVALPPGAVTVDGSLGAGTARFRVAETSALSPADVYVIVLGTEDWTAREARLTGQGVAVTAAGATATITLRPAPVSLAADRPACSASGDCGDATTRATTDVPGRAAGFVTDLRGFAPPADAALRSGFWEASNAEYHPASLYDPARRALTVTLANPHLRADGLPATGAYEAFLPNAMLATYLGIADPASIVASSIVVTRTDGARTTLASPPIITRVAGGVEVRIGGIGYSAPTLRLYGRERALPAKPRSVRVRRPTGSKVRLTWLAPTRSGAMPILSYRVRCGTRSITVKLRQAELTVPAGRTCTVKARTRVGYGPQASVRV